jgi:type I restriction enzyme, S subunit
MGGRVRSQVEYHVVNQSPSIVWLNLQRINDRVDATYFSADYLQLDNAVENLIGSVAVPLRLLLSDARRILYLNTQTFDKPPLNSSGIPFISGIDIDEAMASINWGGVKYVEPWMLDRYPKGELFPGALLIKVKGPNQLAVYVESPPGRALVSGTFVLAGVRDIDPRYLVIYLTSPYAQAWRTRLRQNITVEFTPYDELAEIPIIKPHPKIQLAIGNKLRKAERLRELALRATQSANEALNNLLGDTSLKFADGFAYSWIMPRELLDRVDTRPYHPSVLEVRHKLKGSSIDNARLGSSFDVFTGSTPETEQGDQATNLFVIRVANLTGSGIDYGNIVWGKPGKTTSKAILKEKDVLFGCAGHLPMYVGLKVDIFAHSPFSRSIASTEVMICRHKSNGMISPGTLCWFLRSDWGYFQNQGLVKGMTAHGYPEDVSQIIVPIPPQDLQVAFDKWAVVETQCRTQANCLLQQAKSSVESIIDGTLNESELLAEGEEIEHWLKENPSPHAKERSV